MTKLRILRYLLSNAVGRGNAVTSAEICRVIDRPRNVTTATLKGISHAMRERQGDVYVYYIPETADIEAILRDAEEMEARAKSREKPSVFEPRYSFDALARCMERLGAGARV